MVVFYAGFSVGLLSIYSCVWVFLGPSVTNSGHVVPRFCLYKCLLWSWEDVNSTIMKLKYLVMFLFLSYCNGVVKGQNCYDVPADAPMINTYAPIDWGLIRNIRNQNVQKMKDELRRTYDAYRYYPNSISDGWHDVFTAMTNSVISHKALVKSNRIIKVAIQDETIDTDIPIVKGRYLSPEFTIYFYKEIEAYNR